MARGVQKRVDAVRTVVKTMQHPQINARLEVVHISAHTQFGRRGLFGDYFVLSIIVTFPNGEELRDNPRMYSNWRTLDEVEPVLTDVAAEYGFTN